MEARSRVALLERGDELQAIDAALAAARAGRGEDARVVVEGPAGIGKTRLLREAAARAAADGMRVLHATGSALERDLPYGCAVTLLAGPLRGLPAAGRDAVPELARALLAGEMPPPAADPTLPLLHGLHTLVLALASRAPLLVLVDDAHDADPASLRFLAYVAARLEGVPAALVVAARSGAEPTDPAALEGVGRDARRLSPRALSPAAVAARVRAAHPEATDAFCAGCAEVTAGNPLFLTALLDAVAADGIPVDDDAASRLARLGLESVAHAALGRIAALGPDAVELARAVAVLGEREPLRTAAALAGVDDDAAPETADRLAAAGLLTPGPEPRFTHPIVREAVYEDLGAARRARDHLRAARLLAPAAPEAAASHLLRAERSGEPWAIDVLREAAVAARRRGAPERAVACLRRALDEGPPRALRPALLRDLGSALALVFEPDAVDVLREAWDLETDPPRRSAVALELGRTLIMLGRLAECVEVCDRAAAEPGADAAAIERLQTELISAARLDLSTRPLSLERMRVPPADPENPLWLANVAYEHALAGRPAAEAAALARRALGDGALLAAETSDSPTLYLATNTLTLCECFAEVDAVFAAIIEEARSRGSALGFAIASCFRADAANRRGDPVAGRAHAQASVDASEAHGWALGLPMAVGVLVDALVEQGELDAAEATLQRVPMTAGEALPDNVFFIPVLFSRGRLRIARGDVRAGLEDVLEAGRRQDAWQAPNPTVLPWRSTAAEALLALGEVDRARELAGREVALAEAFGAPRAIAVARRAAALAAGGEAAIEGLRAAAAAVTPEQAPVERARCLVDLGAALRRAGHR
ncbi:MAG: AAA family ATPase, partial [Solirubrobacteraceae bacterium]|nr:AAA family ATPase [Solirubrobacteraceae bacterium]